MYDVRYNIGQGGAGAREKRRYFIFATRARVDGRSLEKQKEMWGIAARDAGHRSEMTLLPMNETKRR